MDRRLPARVLALLALVGVSVALYTVVTGGTAADPGAPSEAARTPTQKGGKTSEKGTRKRTRRRSYTVKGGDTPSGIAEKTGVSVERLLDLNPDLDPQALQTGAKLKLR